MRKFIKLLLLASLVSSAFAASVKLQWGASVPPAGVALTKYNVYRALTSGGQNTSLPPTYSTVDGQTLTFFDNAVAAGTTYFYKITAVGKLADGTLKESPLSNEKSATVTSLPVIIVIPAPVQADPAVILP